MKQAILHLLLRNLQARSGAGFRVKRLGPVSGLLIFLLFGVLAVVGLVGFAALSVGLFAFSVVKSFLPRARPAAPHLRRDGDRDATMTVIDASGKTITTVPRSV